MDPVSAKRREERVKLFATFISNVGVALVVTGVLAPAFTGRMQPSLLLGALAFAGLAHLLAQLVLHWVVRTPRLGEAV